MLESGLPGNYRRSKNRRGTNFSDGKKEAQRREVGGTIIAGEHK